MHEGAAGVCLAIDDSCSYSHRGWSVQVSVCVCVCVCGGIYGPGHRHVLWMLPEMLLSFEDRVSDQPRKTIEEVQNSQLLANANSSATIVSFCPLLRNLPEP